MLSFETVNELTLKVTCSGSDVLFTKAGAFIAGESAGGKNYRFEKVLLGPQGNLGQAALGSILRRVTGENLPLMKVNMNGDSVTYYANKGQHIFVYKLAYGEMISVESENILAFTQDCKYSVRFIGSGVLSQKGIATSTLTGEGQNADVAILTDGNPIALRKDLPPLFLPEMGIRRMWRFCQKEIPSCSAMYRAEAPSRWIRIPSSAGWGRGTAIRR